MIPMDLYRPPAIHPLPACLQAGAWSPSLLTGDPKLRARFETITTTHAAVVAVRMPLLEA